MRGVINPSAILLCSSGIITDHSILSHFCQSSITNSILASELVIICQNIPALAQRLEQSGHVIQTLDETSLLMDYVMHQSSHDIIVITKAVVKLRVTSHQLLKSGQFRSTSLTTAFCFKCDENQGIVSDKLIKPTFLCLKNLIETKLSDVSIMITKVLTLLTYQDKLVLTSHGIMGELDRSVIISLSYLHQFLLDVSVLSNNVLRVFIDLVSKAPFWINFHLNLYIDNSDRQWAALHLCSNIEMLNSIMGHAVFKPLETWKPYFEEIRLKAGVMKELRVRRDELQSHLHILSQMEVLIDTFF